MKSIKLVAIGDDDESNSKESKTSLLITYTTHSPPGENIPRTMEDTSIDVSFEDQNISLMLRDIACQEEYKKLRPFSYPQTDIFLICFSLISPTSYNHVYDLWKPEIAEHCPDTPIILVGLSGNLREEFEDSDEDKQEGMEPISSSKGIELKEKIGARAYIECSCEKQIHINDAFDIAIKVALHPNENINDCLYNSGVNSESTTNKESKCCLIL